MLRPKVARRSGRTARQSYRAVGQDVHRAAGQVLDAVYAFGAGRLADDATLVIAGLQQLVRNRIGPAAGGMTGSGQVSG
jgi:hypothetical protein